MKETVQILDRTPLQVDPEDLAKTLNCRRKQQIEKIQSLLGELGEEDGPIVIYKKCAFSPVDDCHFKLDDVLFENKDLSAYLAKVDKIFAIITSCGTGLHEKAIGKTNMFDQYVMLELCRMSGDQSLKIFESRVKEAYGLNQGSYFFPGEEGWRLEDGRGIFDLLGTEADKMGISLNERHVVKPGFSSYGIYCG